MSPILRFAPSPNGLLHLGHAFSALLNDALARRLGGAWLLRIEDIDPARCRPEYEAGICEDLAWLGLAWPEPVRRQSEHLDAYRQAADELRRRSLLYPCFCTRGEIAREVAAREAASGMRWQRDPDGAPLYPGTCRDLSPAEVANRMEAGRAHAWRLDVAACGAAAGDATLAWTRFAADGSHDCVPADPAIWGDAVIVRKDTPTSYHLAVVVDDAVQGVTHVVRGRDLEGATHLHALLQRLLSLPMPLYHHHDLVRDEGGARLAKSAGSRPLVALRREGIDPAAIRAMLPALPG